MGRKPKEPDKHVYCFCPKCGVRREMYEGKYNIVKKGYERNGLARFNCLECGAWFNEKTGKAMPWLERK